MQLQRLVSLSVCLRGWVRFWLINAHQATMLRQVTEPVWWVTASSPKFSHLVESNTRLKSKTLGRQKPTCIHPPEPVWTCRALSVTAWGCYCTHPPTELFHLIHQTIALRQRHCMRIGQDLTCSRGLTHKLRFDLTAQRQKSSQNIILASWQQSSNRSANRTA